MTAPKNAALRACPFCGGEASAGGVINYHADYEAWWNDGSRIQKAFFVNCVKCQVSNSGFHGHQTVAEAIAAWNARSNPEGDELARALEEAYDQLCSMAKPFVKNALLGKLNATLAAYRSARQ
jgi:hypothetical protein